MEFDILVSTLNFPELTREIRIKYTFPIFITIYYKYLDTSEISQLSISGIIIVEKQA